MSLALFGHALALTIGFLAWVPRRNMWSTALGCRDASAAIFSTAS
ncbi:hypothetical protein SMICM17S_11766 [Streptomyces microflavus]